MKNKFIIDCTTFDQKICNNNYINDQLILTINDVDDLALAWIVFPEKDKKLTFLRIYNSPESEDSLKKVTDEYPKWLWRPGAKHGHGSENITQWLHDNHLSLPYNDNTLSAFLVIAIYDFPYDNIFLPGGKWSFDAKLELNGETKWKNTNFEPSIKNKRGIQYLKILSIKTKEHSLDISESIPETFKKQISIEIKTKHNYIDYDKKNKQIVKENNDD